MGTANGIKDGTDPTQIRPWFVVPQKLMPPFNGGRSGDSENAGTLSGQPEVLDWPLDFDDVVAAAAIGDKQVERALTYDDDTRRDEAQPFVVGRDMATAQTNGHPNPSFGKLHVPLERRVEIDLRPVEGEAAIADALTIKGPRVACPWARSIRDLHGDDNRTRLGRAVAQSGEAGTNRQMANVAVLGATGAVGREFLRLFEERQFPVKTLRLLASARSAGQSIPFAGEKIVIEDAATFDWSGTDYAFFSAGAGRSRAFAPAALAAGATVVDNSSAFRMQPDVPLVVPEVNGHRLTADTRLVANPNCTAAILVTAIAPIERRARIARVIVSTYQSASGGGAAMMEELRSQTEAVLQGKEVKPEILPFPYAFNLFSHNTAIGPDGFNEEESKVMAETRRMLEREDLRLNVTCVRVPVMRAHSESVTLEFEGDAPSEDEIRDWLAQAPGVRVVDDREANHFPMPCEASGSHDVLVGRIRRDPSHPNSVLLFISGDQLLKGAALNAVQIAEELRRLRHSVG